MRSLLPADRGLCLCAEGTILCKDIGWSIFRWLLSRVRDAISTPQSVDRFYAHENIARRGTAPGSCDGFVSVTSEPKNPRLVAPSPRDSYPADSKRLNFSVMEQKAF